MEIEVEAERHPFRFMLKFLVFVGILYSVGRFVAQQKKDWDGITESQARSRIEPKLASKLGDEKAEEIADQIITALKDRGVIAADPEVVVEEIVEDAKDVVAEATGDVSEDE